MKFESLKDWFEAVGLIAIVASLVFVGIELRQSRAIAISDGNLANAEIQIESNNAISQYSRIWNLGNAGDTLNGDERTIFRNLVRNKAIHAFMEYARLDQVEFEEASDSVAAQFSIFLFQNPGARQEWIQSEGFYAQYFHVPVSQMAWKDKVQSNLARLDREASR